MEPTDDKSWDVKTFRAGVVAVVFAVVLNCLMLLLFRIVLNEPLFHHCKSVDRFRYLNYLHLIRHCQRVMVVMNLELDIKIKEKQLENRSTFEISNENSQNILVEF